MIIKERTIPLKIQVLEALLRRIPVNHVKRQQIKEELSRRRTGYHGERSLDYYLSHLSSEKYWIFHDLNLPDGSYNCQIDTLLLTSDFVLILDSKNIGGKLLFDCEIGQFIQYYNGDEKSYDDPIDQAYRHQRCIKNVITTTFNLPNIPIDFLVIISNPQSIISTRGCSEKVKHRICKSHSLPQKIEFMEKIYSREAFSKKELRRLSRLLLKVNTPPATVTLQNSEIKKTDLLTGIHCPSCSYRPMTRFKRKWYCPSCKTFSFDAHFFGLHDYFLLFDSKITNKQFREFAHLSSPHTAKRLLQSLNLKSNGNNKVREYCPDSIF